MIYVQLTNGFGNNLFQYNAAVILADFLKTSAFAIPPFKDYYGIAPLKKMGVKFGQPSFTNAIRINGDREYIRIFNESTPAKDVILSGYFEDYRYFMPSRNKLRSIFPDFTKRKNNDLVIHLRTGDRLFMKNEFYTKPQAKDYLKAIGNFKFDKLHIVTDMPFWRKLNVKTLTDISFHSSVPREQCVPIEESVNYFNSLYEAFERYHPIVKNRSVDEDFNFIRTFNNILFEHGTMSWWAAFLSDAEKVGVYGPWRPWKGISNKNLSDVPLDNWFKWK